MRTLFICIAIAVILGGFVWWQLTGSLILKKRLNKRNDTKVVVGQQARNKGYKADYYIYLRQIIGRAVLYFLLGILVNGILELM